MVIDEDSGTRKPLPIELAPDGLSPTGISNSQVTAGLVKIVPVYARDQMPQRIGMRVGNHLGFSARSGGKIHQEDVVIRIHVFRPFEFRHTFPFLVKVVEAFRHLGSNADQAFDRRAFRHRLENMSRYLAFACADDGLDIRTVVPVDDILACKHVRGRNGNRPDLAEGHHCQPELVAPLQHYHHHISLPDAQCLEIRGGSVRERLYILE